MVFPPHLQSIQTVRLYDQSMLDNQLKFLPLWSGRSICLQISFALSQFSLQSSSFRSSYEHQIVHPVSHGLHCVLLILKEPLIWPAVHDGNFSRLPFEINLKRKSHSGCRAIENPGVSVEANRVDLCGWKLHLCDLWSLLWSGGNASESDLAPITDTQTHIQWWYKDK